MRKLGALVLLAALIVSLLPAGAALAHKPTRATTDHVLAAPEFDGVYMLGWEGTIAGDINGCVQWWMDTTTWTSFPAPKNPAQASHYTAKTLVFEGECGDSEIIFEALERGTTTMANMTWRANGVVVKAKGDPDWVGRRVHERGTFEMTFDPTTGLPNWGEGTSTLRLN